MKPMRSSLVGSVEPYRAIRGSPLPKATLQMAEFPSAMATERDYSHRSTVQKLGVTADQRVEIAGDVVPGSGAT